MLGETAIDVQYPFKHMCFMPNGTENSLVENDKLKNAGRIS
jgi:hypothetical protein